MPGVEVEVGVGVPGEAVGAGVAAAAVGVDGPPERHRRVAGHPVQHRPGRHLVEHHARRTRATARSAPDRACRAAVAPPTSSPAVEALTRPTSSRHRPGAQLHADALGPTGRVVLGTACCHVRWNDPPMTNRSPWPSCSRCRAAPVGAGSPVQVGAGPGCARSPATRSRPARRAAPGSLATRSACHATLSAAVPVAGQPRGAERPQLAVALVQQRRCARVSAGCGRSSSSPNQAVSRGTWTTRSYICLPVGSARSRPRPRAGRAAPGRSCHPPRQQVEPRAVGERRCAGRRRASRAPVRRGDRAGPAASPDQNRTCVRC